MESTPTAIGYLSIDAEALLRTCFSHFGNQGSYEKALELAIRGTLPKSVRAEIEKSFVAVDPKGLQHRFSPKKYLYIDSWSELVNLASLTYLVNSVHPPEEHFVASIGLETAFKEASLREKYLSDGVISCFALNAQQLVQSCLAQNIRGGSAGKNLQQEIIDRLQAKLNTSPAEPGQTLAVTVISETEDIDKLNFTEIAKETITRYKGKTDYGEIFCIVPSVGLLGLQVMVVHLAEFLPGGETTIALINVSDL